MTNTLWSQDDALIEVTSAFQGFSQPVSELIDDIHRRGWTVHKLHVKDGEYEAEGKNPHKETLKASGRTDATAVANLLIKIMRREHMRQQSSLAKLGAWDAAPIEKQWGQIAQAYAGAPVYEPKAAVAWMDLAQDCQRRCQTIRQQLAVEYTNDPVPYQDLNELREDIMKKRHVTISRAHAHHPVWSEQQVLDYRLVVDVLGHASTGGDWGWHGSCMAFAALAPMLADLQQKALYTELLGQAAFGSFYQRWGPQKICFLEELIAKEQEKENKPGHHPVHPSQSIVPAVLPSIFSRVASLGTHEAFDEWQPGRWGKGLMDNDGVFHAWATSPEGSPHHNEYVEYAELPDEDGQWYVAGEDGEYAPHWAQSPIDIAPSGHYTHANGLNYGGPPDGHEPAFEAQHPALKYVPDHAAWWDQYGPQASTNPGFGHGRNVLDALDRQSSAASTDPNADWESGIQPLQDNAYLWQRQNGVDPLDAQSVSDALNPLEAGVARLHPSMARQAVVNALRGSLLGSRNNAYGHAVHYQALMGLPADVDDPIAFWDSLEQAREAHNQAQGYAPGSHKQHWAQEQQFKQWVKAANPQLDDGEVQRLAKREMLHMLTEEEERILAADQGEQLPAEVVEHEAYEALKTRLKALTKPTVDQKVDFGEDHLYHEAGLSKEADDPYNAQDGEDPSGIFPSAQGPRAPIDGDAGAPYFPSGDEVVATNRDVHAAAGQPERFGVENAGYLGRVLGNAQGVYNEAPPGPEQTIQAAAHLAHGLASHSEAGNQIFRDGNRRTSFWTTRHFLDQNGLGFVSPGHKEDQMLSRYLNGVVEGAQRGVYNHPPERFADLFRRRYINRRRVGTHHAGMFPPYLASRLRPLAQIGRHAAKLSEAAREDLLQHKGHGHHFRAQALSLGIPGLGPRQASNAWLHLAPQTSELGVIDPHITEVLGHDYLNDHSNRDYFKHERELAAGRDASGYSHMPLGQFSAGLFDLKAGGPGWHPDRSPFKAYAPTSHTAVDWQAQDPLLPDWPKPYWWESTAKARDEVGKDFDRTVGTQFSRDEIPFKTAASALPCPKCHSHLDTKSVPLTSRKRLSCSSCGFLSPSIEEEEIHAMREDLTPHQSATPTARTPYVVHPGTGQRVPGQPGTSLMAHIKTTMGHPDAQSVWSQEPEYVCGKGSGGTIARVATSQAPGGGSQAFSHAISELAALQASGEIRDFVLIGSVASSFYAPPRATEDLDAVILVDSDEEYYSSLTALGESRGMEGMHVILGGVPVQLFPVTTGPLYDEALRSARSFEVGGYQVKVASPEVLTLLARQAGRPQDQAREADLQPHVDPGQLAELSEQHSLPAPPVPEPPDTGSQGTVAARIYESKRAIHERQASAPIAEKLASLSRLSGHA